MWTSACSFARLADACPSAVATMTRCCGAMLGPSTARKLEASLPITDSPAGMGCRLPSISRYDMKARCEHSRTIWSFQT